jgi:hypothetical protein
MVKEPAPIVERITLLSAPGEYRIVFVNGGRTDACALRVARETVELVAVVIARRPVMQMWFITQDHVVSTYGAGVNTFAE